MYCNLSPHVASPNPSNPPLTFLWQGYGAAGKYSRSDSDSGSEEQDEMQFNAEEDDYAEEEESEEVVTAYWITLDRGEYWM